MFGRRLLRDRRGSVALWIGLTMPTLLMALGLGIEVGSWSAAEVELQRTADLSALAGVMNYNQTSSAQSATGAAANVAEVNGITGAASRSWNSATQTLTDNNVVAAVVTGIKSSSDTSIKVIVKQTVPLAFAKVFNASGSITLSASAWSEQTASSTGGQPCILAIKTAAAGGSGITLSGTTNFNEPSCTVRSNAAITSSGTVEGTTDGLYAAGNITHSGTFTVTGGTHANDGTITDPFVSYTTLQTALGKLGSGGTSKVATSNVTLSPGTYSQLITSGTVTITFNPGLYIINGSISFSGTTTLNGTGVTIISSGSVSTSGTLTGNLQAATSSSATNGAVPGVVLAGTGSSVGLSGSNFLFAGTMYYPKASMAVSGTFSLASGATCGEMLAGSISMSGSPTLAGNCSSYGTPSFGSVPGSSTVFLAQ